MAKLDKCNRCGIELAEIDGLCDFCLHLPRCVMCGIFEVHLCEMCTGWEERMSDQCWQCEEKFKQTAYHYKTLGNWCNACSNAFEKWFSTHYQENDMVE